MVETVEKSLKDIINLWVAVQPSKLRSSTLWHCHFHHWHASCRARRRFLVICVVALTWLQWETIPSFPVNLLQHVQRKGKEKAEDSRGAV